LRLEPCQFKSVDYSALNLGAPRGIVSLMTRGHE
jgi:hypothetical protein